MLAIEKLNELDFIFEPPWKVVEYLQSRNWRMKKGALAKLLADRQDIRDWICDMTVPQAAQGYVHLTKGGRARIMSAAHEAGYAAISEGIGSGIQYFIRRPA